MGFRTALVVVVYNQHCGNAVTCKTIYEGSVKPDMILIVDNSTKEMNNLQYCRERGWMYHSMGGNAGLTKAYNAAISVLHNQADLVVWADDDTVFPPDYFEKLLEYASAIPADDIFLPVVSTKTMILSPAIYTQRRIIPVKDLSELANRQLSAINSGMAVRMALYDDYRYDEAIFLDYVDHDFMCCCNLNGKRIRVMDDVQLFQNFFAEEKPSYAARKRRMKIYCKDVRVFEAKYGKSRWLTEWDLLVYCYYQYRVMLKTWLEDKQIHVLRMKNQK